MELPPNTPSLFTQWVSLAETCLREGNDLVQQAVLEYLSVQTTLSTEQVKPLFLLVQDCVLSADPDVRYFARKARYQCEELYPQITSAFPQLSTPTLGDSLPEAMATRDLLLKKIRLGSRYVAFEAIERLTDSKDPSLAEPLLKFL